MTIKKDIKNVLATKLIESINRRQSKDINGNSIILITGQTGSGKSWYSLSLANILDKTFSNNLRVYFSLEKLLEAVVKGEIGAGQACILEEMGVSAGSREFMTKSNRSYGKLFQTVRSHNTVLILNLPNISSLDSSLRKLCHYHGVMRGIDRKNKVSYSAFTKIEHDEYSGKCYRKYPLFKIDNAKYKLTKFGLPQPPQDILGFYEDMKKNFQDELYKSILEDVHSDKPKVKVSDVDLLGKFNELPDDIKDTIYSKKGGLKADKLVSVFDISWPEARKLSNTYLYGNIEKTKDKHTHGA